MQTEINYKLLGEKIIKKRKAMKMMQKDLANTLGTAVSHLSDIERGVKKPFLEMLMKTLHQSLKKLLQRKVKSRYGKTQINLEIFFSVEGETERWYLKWLQDLINTTEEAAYKVSIDCPVKQNPLKHAKSLVVTKKIEVYHFFDYESDEEIHVKRFTEAMVAKTFPWL